MTMIIGLLINLLLLALIVIVILWVLDLIANAFGVPAKIITIIKAIVALIALLILVQMLLGGWAGFYPMHPR